MKDIFLVLKKFDTFIIHTCISIAPIPLSISMWKLKLKMDDNEEFMLIKLKIKNTEPEDNG